MDLQKLAMRVQQNRLEKQAGMNKYQKALKALIPGTGVAKPGADKVSAQDILDMSTFNTNESNIVQAKAGAPNVGPGGLTELQNARYLQAVADGVIKPDHVNPYDDNAYVLDDAADLRDMEQDMNDTPWLDELKYRLKNMSDTSKMNIAGAGALGLLGGAAYDSSDGNTSAPGVAAYIAGVPLSVAALALVDKKYNKGKLSKPVEEYASSAWDTLKGKTKELYSGITAG